jgi:hypothetical protein
MRPVTTAGYSQIDRRAGMRVDLLRQADGVDGRSNTSVGFTANAANYSTSDWYEQKSMTPVA